MGSGKVVHFFFCFVFVILFASVVFAGWGFNAVTSRYYSFIDKPDCVACCCHYAVASYFYDVTGENILGELVGEYGDRGLFPRDVGSMLTGLNIGYVNIGRQKKWKLIEKLERYGYVLSLTDDHCYLIHKTSIEGVEVVRVVDLIGGENFWLLDWFNFFNPEQTIVIKGLL